MNISTIVQDLENAKDELKDIGDSCVTIFGSARFKEDSYYYKKAIQLGKELSDNGYNVITGGSGGIMEASNRGAKESSKTKSIGLHMMNLPNEERENIYLDRDIEFHYFFTRKIMLTSYSIGYIIMPGGFGTLDEFFEILNLIRTNNHPPASIILFGAEYWSKLYNFMQTTMLDYQTINSDDLSLIKMSDDIDEVISIISQRYKSNQEKVK